MLPRINAARTPPAPQQAAVNDLNRQISASAAGYRTFLTALIYYNTADWKFLSFFAKKIFFYIYFFTNIHTSMVLYRYHRHADDLTVMCFYIFSRLPLPTNDLLQESPDVCQDRGNAPLLWKVSGYRRQSEWSGSMTFCRLR